MTQLPAITHPHRPHQCPALAHPFLDLPPEIHTLIANELPYPDLLSLTLSHPHFIAHPHIHTTKTARVDWLLSRATQHLPLPTQTRCRWSSDREFVSNAEVKSIMRRRRLHAECAEVWERGHSAGECLVFGGNERCPRIHEGEPRKDRNWIRSAETTFGSLGGFVVNVRSGSRRTSRIREWAKPRWIAAVVVAFFACVLYAFV